MSMTELLFSFKGRLNRKPYWLTTLAIIVILVAVILVVLLADEGDAIIGLAEDFEISVPMIALLILYAVLAWIGLALGVKRLHDRDKSGWWIVLFYVVPGILNFLSERAGAAGIILGLIGLAITVWAFVELGCRRGSIGSNRYGPDPLSPTAA